VGSASTVPAKMLAAMTVVALEDIRVLTTNKFTPARGLSASYRNDDDGILSAKAKEAMAYATAPSHTNLELRTRISSLGAPRRTDQWRRK
jgi:hypothetical protein